MPVISGKGTAIGIGKETAWGTAVSRTKWLPAISWNLSRNPSRAYSPELAQPNSTGDYSQVYDGLEIAGGDIDVALRYGSVGFLVYAIMGATPVESGAGPTGYVHTFSLSSIQPSLTLEGILGDSATSEVFEGDKATSATFSFVPGQIARLKVSFIAETASARGAAGTPTYPTESYVMGHHGSVLGWNSGTYAFRSVDITIDRKLDRMPECQSNLTTEPEPTGFLEVKIKATLTWRANVLTTGFIAGTKSDVTFTATLGTKSWAFTLNNACILSCSDPISSAGVLTQTVEWIGLADSGAPSLTIVLTNSSATYEL